jgi:hypothetical protein
MESEITAAGTGSELSLSEPHFDDEATVLSARPVVPLDELPAYTSPTATGLGRNWMFATIVLGALLLGVVGGAGYYSYLNRRAAQSSANTDELAAGVEGIATEQAVATDVGKRTPAPSEDARTPAQSEEAPVELSEKEISESLKEPADYPNKTRKARRVGVITFPSTRDEEQIRKEREERIREDLKAARKEEKRRKHELVEREKRRSRDQLTRIREIFEGPQKP